ncbi:hypothetical protein BOX37_08710 [Nocardia mangyaensis]|uniref:DUF742 domain-containing protein n=1 Tax=Nocardia mangyaensis TaxID=2213200 RepID=A0A1J0VPS9_9NOCA|nr:DUF742 domain-containing protein [Nocardia mangyaensis]APE34043.1 hypothetical protein BOX37_08710 [Nocardia mangyaensis]
MTDEPEHWYEEDAGPLVRLYAVTRGRGRAPRRELDLTTLLIDAHAEAAPRRPGPEYDAIVEMCRAPLSVAEVSAHLHLPLTLTKVLVGDLIDDGRLAARAPEPTASEPSTDLHVLRAVLAGIRRVQI